MQRLTKTTLPLSIKLIITFNQITNRISFWIKPTTLMTKKAAITITTVHAYQVNYPDAEIKGVPTFGNFIHMFIVKQRVGEPSGVIWNGNSIGAPRQELDHAITIFLATAGSKSKPCLQNIDRLSDGRHDDQENLLPLERIFWQNWHSPIFDLENPDQHDQSGSREPKFMNQSWRPEIKRCTPAL